LPALRLQRFGAPWGHERDDGFVGARLDDAADSGDSDAGDLARYTSRRGSCKQELVVFAAIEGLGLGRRGMEG
jgi:hypothetical protein